MNTVGPREGLFWALSQPLSVELGQLQVWCTVALPVEQVIGWHSGKRRSCLGIEQSVPQESDLSHHHALLKLLKMTRGEVNQNSDVRSA